MSLAADPGGYGRWAWQYRERQWVSVLPLPYRKKTPPPKDYTGQVVKKTGLLPHIPDDAQVAAWVAEHPRGNLALRMPGDVIGIDVDAYEYEYHVKGDDKKPLYDEHGDPVMAWGLKTGDIIIAEMEDLLGELPATWRSSSRTEGVSGIRFYRVPASLLWRDVGEHVETIWWGHRYAAVWPSINPDSNAHYLWFDENSPEEGWGHDIPKIVDLPELPEAWVRHLSQEAVEPSGLVGPATAGGDQHRRPTRFAGSHNPGERRQFTRKQAAEFVQPHLDELRHATVGTINNRLNDAAKVIGHFVPAVWPDLQARIFLMDALRDTGYDGKSWKADKTIDSAFNTIDWVAELVPEPTGWVGPGQVATRPRGDAPEPPEDHEDPPETAGFWDTRPMLAFVRNFALHRYAAPWAVLGAVLARAVACVEPNIQLPAVIGTEASLNLFVGLVGPSGGGKDIASGVAKALLLPVEGREPIPLDVIPLGSGEGLSHVYMKLPPKLTRRRNAHDDDSQAIGLGASPDPNVAIQYRTRALVNVAEIDTMGSLTQRIGSTIGGQLRQAWSGSQLGFQYVGDDKRMIVPEHSYRMCLTAGIQPGRAGVLLDETDGGTPQRFLWVPATNSELELPTDEQIDNPPPPTPGQEWTPPRYQGGTVTFDVCNIARRIIVRAHVARGRGEGDALDGHSLLNRLKTAAALALLCGDRPQRQCEITEEDWELAGAIMAVSDSTRAAVRRELAEQAKIESEKKGYATARQTIVAEEVMENDGVKKALRWLRGRLGHDWVPQGELRKDSSGRISKHVKDALDVMLQAGEIEAESYGAGGHQTRKVRLRGA